MGRSRKGKKYEYEGKMYGNIELVELAKKKYNLDISQATMDRRIRASKWDIQKAISTPVAQQTKNPSPEEKKKRQRKAVLKYQKSHPEVMQRIHSFSYTKRFIKDFATLPLLRSLRTQLEEKQKTGKCSIKSWPSETDKASLGQVNKQVSSLMSWTRNYLEKHATPEKLKELIDLTDKRIQVMEKKGS